MVNIKPTIEIYDSEGDLTRAYNKALNKMIYATMEVDLSQFDFDEVYKGKCKEFDDLVTKLCKQSGLGSSTIYNLLLERFTDEDEYLMDYDVMYTYGLDELEESNKSAKRSLKESKHSIRFEDFLALNNEPNDEFKVHVNDVHYATCDKESIFMIHDELLNYDVVEWCCASAKPSKIIVWLK